jgi:hypothetical protein
MTGKLESLLFQVAARSNAHKMYKDVFGEMILHNVHHSARPLQLGRDGIFLTSRLFLIDRLYGY